MKIKCGVIETMVAVCLTGFGVAAAPAYAANSPCYKANSIPGQPGAWSKCNTGVIAANSGHWVIFSAFANGNLSYELVDVRNGVKVFTGVRTNMKNKKVTGLYSNYQLTVQGWKPTGSLRNN